MKTKAQYVSASDKFPLTDILLNRRFASQIARFPARFQSKVRYEAKTKCWLWIGATNYAPGFPQYAYGRYAVDGRDPRSAVYAHIFAYEFVNGPLLLNQLDVDHRCNNKLCVNPKHLRPLTHQDNCRLRRKRQRVVGSVRWYKEKLEAL